MRVSTNGNAPDLPRLQTDVIVAIDELEAGRRAAALPRRARVQGQAVTSRPMPRASSHTDQPM
jgi:hypothetical protein